MNSQDFDARIFDKADFLERVEGDMELARDLADLFLEDAAEKMAAIGQGVERKDGNAIEKAAHSLKGASANLSAVRLRQIAAELERTGRAQDIGRCALLLQDLETAMDEFAAALRTHIVAPLD